MLTFRLMGVIGHHMDSDAVTQIAAAVHPERVRYYRSLCQRASPTMLVEYAEIARCLGLVAVRDTSDEGPLWLSLDQAASLTQLTQTLLHIAHPHLPVKAWCQRGGSMSSGVTC